MVDNTTFGIHLLAAVLILLGTCANGIRIGGDEAGAACIKTCECPHKEVAP